MIGGLGFGRWCWFKQTPTLSRHFSTITFDIRGEHNFARGVVDLTAEVIALLDYLGVEKTHVLGTSLGDFVAQELALERSDPVDRLTLVCTSYGGVGPEPITFQALGRMLGWGSLNAEDATRRGLETATSETYRASNHEEFDLILRWRLADSSSLSDYSQQVAAGARFDASRDLGNITFPTLVIHGAEDRYIPVANAVALAEAIPDAKLRVVRGRCPPGLYRAVRRGKQGDRLFPQARQAAEAVETPTAAGEAEDKATRRAHRRGQSKARLLRQDSHPSKGTRLPRVIGGTADEAAAEGRRRTRDARRPEVVAKSEEESRFREAQRVDGTPVASSRRLWARKLRGWLSR